MFKTYQAFHKAYAESYGRAKAYEELETLLRGSEQMVINLNKQLLANDQNKPL